MRYFITLAYDGTDYHGWQIQPQDKSVQSTLQEALSVLLQKEIAVTGAGRTDTGVHARKMVAHFDVDTEVDVEKLAYRLNGVLSHDIAVEKIELVADDAHARFCATSRTYHYYVHVGKSPFLRNYSWRLMSEPNFEAMNKAAEKMLYYEDFTSFSKVNTDTKTNNCHIEYAKWVQLSPTEWRFEIKANRFLRNMVRAIVGTLMEVGRGAINIDEFCNIIEKKDRCAAGDSVPARGLFLVDVTYPF